MKTATKPLAFLLLLSNLILTSFAYGVMASKQVPDPIQLLLFALYWNQEDVGTLQEDYKAPDLLCLLRGECTFIGGSECDEFVTFEDPEFESFIRGRLGNPEGQICRTQMESLTFISDSLSSGPDNPNCRGNITSIQGLEYAINLESFAIGCNSIGSLAPLAGLTKLKSITIHDNEQDSFVSFVKG